MRRTIFLSALFSLSVLSFLFLHVSPSSAGSALLIDAIASKRSSVPVGTPINPPFIFDEKTISFTYAGGIVTFTTCPDKACAWAIDDAAKLMVTRPDGTTQSGDFISNTQDIPAANVTSLFQVGANSVTIQMLDRMGPDYGLPRSLYLLETATTPPGPSMVIEPIVLGTTSAFHPGVGVSRDPVSTLTGSFLYTRTDVEIPGRGPVIRFSRAYNSSDTRVGPLGPGWTHSYAMHLATPDAASTDIIVVDPQGRSDRFAKNTDGSYSPPAGISTKLVKNGTGTYTLSDSVQTQWTFAETGQLSRITDRFGNVSELSYNATNQVTSVSDPAGRGVLSFSYNGSGRLTGITDWSNRTVTFGYDGSGRLESATDREGKVTRYAYDGTSQRITTITDARNTVVVTNSYDS